MTFFSLKKICIGVQRCQSLLQHREANLWQLTCWPSSSFAPWAKQTSYKTPVVFRSLSFQSSNVFASRNIQNQATADPLITLEKSVLLKKSTKAGNQETCNQEKPYDAWTKIQEGFADLYDHLNPEDPTSDVDKVVKYILDQNIPVRHVNIVFTNKILMDNKASRDQIVKKCPKIKIGRFGTLGLKSEEEIIKQNWEKLVEECRVSNSDKCLEDFTFLRQEKKVKNSLYKQIVLGCYLAQGLVHVRLGLDVMARASRTVYYHNKSKYTEEENALILKEVEKSGRSVKTLNNLRKVIRKENIPYQLNFLVKSRGLTGRWSKEEYKFFFDGLFENGIPPVESAIKFVESRAPADIYNASKHVPGRSKIHVYNQWKAIIKPTLLAHHMGIVDKCLRTEVFQYIVDRKITCNQDIDWKDFIRHYPSENSRSLNIILRPITKQAQSKNRSPLYVEALEYLGESKHKRRAKAGIAHRKNIIHLYDIARGISNN